MTSAACDTAVIAVLTEGGLGAWSDEWDVDDIVLHTAGSAELEARLRLAVARHGSNADSNDPAVIRVGDVVIDETTYSARVRGTLLSLTYKEIELLKFLAQHPGQVFTRVRLLQEVWGHGNGGVSRTVDTHVRYLRAKLGPESESVIGTVRNVGYTFIPPPAHSAAQWRH